MFSLLLQTIVTFAANHEVWDATPEHSQRQVLLVASPGIAKEGYLPLIRALRNDGRDVHLVTFPCRGQDTAGLVRGLRDASATLNEGFTVVAHGLGGTLALLAAPELKARGFALSAPVLGFSDQAVTNWLSVQDVGAQVDLNQPLSWNERPVLELLIGTTSPPLTCLSAPFAREIQDWVPTSSIHFESLSAPVWGGFSLGDNLATLESSVPAMRRIPERRLTRLGRNRLDNRDFTHSEMLTHRTPIRWLVRAARKVGR